MAPNIDGDSHPLLVEKPHNEISRKTKSKLKLHSVHPELAQDENSWVYDQDIKWTYTIGIFFIHVTGIYGFYYGVILQQMKLSSFIFLTVHGVLSAMGITVGVHRFWSHRSFRANLPMRIILMILYAGAGQLKVTTWARDHRLHHKFSETIYDPYNAKRGLFYAHCGWLMKKRHPVCLKKGDSIDVSDLQNDPVVQFFDNNFILLKMFFCVAFPTLMVRYYFEDLWWIAITTNMTRYMVTLNNTWFINSLAHNHTSGTHPYNKFIGPTDNIVTAMLTFGEGWHNFHHTFPWDYRSAEFGMDWLNLPTNFIDMFAKVGWAYDLKTASKELIMKQAKRKGDGSRFVGGKAIAEAKEE